MEPTQKPITVVYSVALLSLVVMAAFVLLIIFGHRGHKAAAVADPLIVSAKYVSTPPRHAHHRSTMALSTTGYTASGAGTTAANGDYVPVTGANATYNGATQYTNGTDFLVYNGSGTWFITGTPNIGSAPFYNSGAGGSTTNMPLTGWVLTSGSSYSAPAPTFAVYSGGGGGGTTARRRPPIFF